MTLIFDQLNPDERRIYSALRSVLDPEIGENMIDLGLIYGINIHDHIATVTFTMTSYACPMSEMVIDSIEEAVNKALSAGMELDLHLVWEPAWDPSMMCEQAKQRLGWE
jgi:metal-sulfur cluster biosynthetic enzyme